MKDDVLKENISTIEKITIGNGKEFEAEVGRFTEPLRMEKLGCSIVDLKPGKKAWPYHLHYGNDELFIILKGSGVIRYDDEEHNVSEGDVIYTPSGDGTAHQIINTSSKVLQYYAVSTRQDPEICYYPDSEKFGSYYTDKDANQRNAFIANKDSNTGYYSGEEK